MQVDRVDAIALRKFLKKGSTDTEWPADEDASNPHGGTDGSKVLEADTFVLIDVG
jgi:hypothetical protein